MSTIEERRRELNRGFDTYDDYIVSVLGRAGYLSYMIACDESWLAWHREHPEDTEPSIFALVQERLESRREELQKKNGATGPCLAPPDTGKHGEHGAADIKSGDFLSAPS